MGRLVPILLGLAVLAIPLAADGQRAASMVINLKTARAYGLTILPTLTARAERVIDP